MSVTWGLESGLCEHQQCRVETQLCTPLYFQVSYTIRVNDAAEAVLLLEEMHTAM